MPGAAVGRVIARKDASWERLQRMPKISRTRGGRVPLMMWFWSAMLPRAGSRDRLPEGDKRRHLQRVLGRVQVGRGEFPSSQASNSRWLAGTWLARQPEQLAETHVVLPEVLALPALSGRTIVSYIARPESAITASVHSISSGSKAE